MLPQLPPDKALHAIYGAVAFTAAGSAAALVGHADIARPIGMGAAVLAGLAKELADYIANRRASERGVLPSHGIEAADAVATACGGLFIWISTALTGQ